MPRLDGTGPQGQGPKTGRGLGPCGRGRGLGLGTIGLEEREKMLGEELSLIRKKKESTDK